MKAGRLQNAEVPARLMAIWPARLGRLRRACGQSLAGPV